MQANASLTRVTSLYSVADAATKALTVDSGLGSVLNLLSLAQEVGKVTTSRVTMLSAPTVAYARTPRGPSRCSSTRRPRTPCSPR